MEYLRGFLIAGLLTLSGGGLAVVVENLNTESPRLMDAGIAAIVVGVLGGGLALGRSFQRSDRDAAFRRRFE